MALESPKFDFTPYPRSISSALSSESSHQSPKSKISPYIFKRPESSNSASFGAVVLNPTNPMTIPEKIVQLNLGKHDFREKGGSKHIFLKKKAPRKTFDPREFTLFAKGNGTAVFINEHFPGKIFKFQTVDFDEDTIFREAQILDYLSFLDKGNKFVPKFNQAFSFNAPDERPYLAHAICMEKLDTDLFKEIISKGKRLKLNDPLLKQLCEIIRFYHANNFVYGDIKPHNFGLKRSAGSKGFDQIKGIDFDVSEFLLPGETLTGIMTPRLYRAPEVILELPYDHKIDIFSLGCLLYELYVGESLIDRNCWYDESMDNLRHLHVFFERFGRYPEFPYINRVSFSDYFDYNPMNKSYKIKQLGSEISIRKGHFVDILKEKFAKDGVSEQVGNDFIDLLTNMLEYDPRKRFNADQVVNHPFFSHTKKAKKFASTPRRPARKKMKVKHPKTEKGD